MGCSHQPQPPKLPFTKLLANLPRCAISIVTQLVTGHIALNIFLKKIQAMESVLCPRCHMPETVSHFLLYCSRYTVQCRVLRYEIGIASASIPRMLSDAKCLPHTLHYIADMKQLKDYMDVATCPAS